MIGIRFHGRGGHGVKTASRILGTAAFESGFQVQDSPIYGAERRGAAVAAFTRISRGPIRERGVIVRPDLIVIGDETLLEDAAAGVLEGVESASAVFVNTAASEISAQKHGIAVPVVGIDVTTLMMDQLGKATALSVPLAAAAARLSGLIDFQQLRSAVEEELRGHEIAEVVIEKNLDLAGSVFDRLQPAPIRSYPATEAAEEVCEIGYDGPLHGSPCIVQPGNAQLRRTGSWRVERPEVDRDICTRCRLCYVLCPDGAIALDDEGYPVIDYDNCKGCMICARQCPVGGIFRKKEVRSW